MPIISLRVLDLPDERAGFMQPQGPGPFIESDGDDTWVCGGCGRVLCVDMNDTVGIEVEFDGPLVMQCPDCGAGNRIPNG